MVRRPRLTIPIVVQVILGHHDSESRTDRTQHRHSESFAIPFLVEQALPRPTSPLRTTLAILSGSSPISRRILGLKLRHASPGGSGTSHTSAPDLSTLSLGILHQLFARISTGVPRWLVFQHKFVASSGHASGVGCVKAVVGRLLDSDRSYLARSLIPPTPRILLNSWLVHAVVGGPGNASKYICAWNLYDARARGRVSNSEPVWIRACHRIDIEMNSHRRPQTTLGVLSRYRSHRRLATPIPLETPAFTEATLNGNQIDGSEHRLVRHRG